VAEVSVEGGVNFPMKKIRYFLEYIPVRAFDLFFQLWPRSAALKMGECLGFVMSHVDRFAPAACYKKSFGILS